MTTNEFPHSIPAAKIGPEPFNIKFDATERQCAALAKRYNIVSVESLSGNATLRREGDGMTIHVAGSFEADVTQACVTSLDPVPDRITETFEGWFLDELQATSFSRAKKKKETETDILADALAMEDDEMPVPAEQEDPEPVVNGMVDIGELVAQFLSLALNPYPHTEEILAQGPLGIEAEPEKPNPFAALKDWKAE